MKKKRLARVIIAAVVTAAILVAIIVGCGPKWGDGSANVNGSNSKSSSSASDNVSSNDNAAQSNNNYATRITVKLPSYYLENMVFQRGKTLVVKGTATTSQRGKVVDPTQLITRFPKERNQHQHKLKFPKMAISPAPYLNKKQVLNHIH